MLLAPHKWWLKIKSIFPIFAVAGERLGKNAKQKQQGVHVQVLCGMKDVMVKKILSVIFSGNQISGKEISGKPILGKKLPGNQFLINLT